MGIRLRIFTISLMAGSLIMIKMFFNPCPENFIYYNYVQQYNNEKLFEKINGQWEGHCTYSDQVPNRDQITQNTEDLLFDSQTNEPDSTYSMQVRVVNDIHVSIGDSLLIIEKLIPELSEQYKLSYTNPGIGLIAYLPIRFDYLDDELVYYDHDSIYCHYLYLSVLENDTLQLEHIRDHSFKIILYNKNSK